MDKFNTGKIFMISGPECSAADLLELECWNIDDIHDDADQEKEIKANKINAN